MLDRATIEKIINDIQKEKNYPYKMDNEKIADMCYPFVLAKYPKAQLVKCQNPQMQWIILSKKAKEVLVKELGKMRKDQLDKIKEIDQVVKSIQ